MTTYFLTDVQDANGVGTQSSVLTTEAFDDDGLGYGSGAAVTQGTGRTSAVVINAYDGAITLISAAGSTTPASFTVTNSKVAATDTIIVNQKSGTDLYTIDVTYIADGSFQITSNTKSGTTTEQPVFNFAIIKAKAS